MKRIAVCDREEKFVMTLASFMNEKYKNKFEVLPFTQTDKLLFFGKENPFTVICVANTVLDAYETQEMISLGSHIIYLTKQKTEQGVFMYQPVEEMARQILNYCVEEGLGEEFGLFNKPKQGTKKRYGIYCPVQDPFQSIIALTMGQMLSEKKKVLCISFEPYSGFEYFLQKKYQHDLMDLLFFLKEDSKKFSFRLSNMVEKIQNLNYIPPVFSCADLEEVDVHAWKELIDKICEETEYDIILLNLSDRIRGVFELLLDCDKVFTGVYEDGFLQAKVLQYESLLRYMKQDKILDCTQKYEICFYCGLSGQTDLLTHKEIRKVVKEMIKDDL